MYLHKPNSKWPKWYEAETLELLKSANVSIEFHHIGSTSVPGLYSKDVLDILGLIDSFESAMSLIDNYVVLGYEYRGEYGIARRPYFVRQTPYVIHLHIHEHNDENAKNHLNFKTQLSSRPELLRELNELKINLHKKYPDDKAQYQKEKKFFYDRVHSMRVDL